MFETLILFSWYLSLLLVMINARRLVIFFQELALINILVSHSQDDEHDGGGTNQTSKQEVFVNLKRKNIYTMPKHYCLHGDFNQGFSTFVLFLKWWVKRFLNLLA